MRLCGVFYCAVLIASCGVEQDSHLHHKVDDPVRNLMAWNWVRISKEIALDIMGYTKQSPMALPLENVAQYWIDRLDHLLRQRYPDQMGSIPKPESLVLNDSSVNAYVQTLPVCYSGKFVFGEGEREIEFSHYMRNSQWDFNATPCLPGLAKDMTSVVESFQDQYPECKIVKTDRDAYHFYGCDLFNNLNMTSKNIVLDQTSSIITFFKGIFSLMEKEEDFVAVIYHELAHYYRSHGVALSHEYRFLYDSSHQDRTQRPAVHQDKHFKDYFEAHIYVKNYFSVLSDAKLEAPAYLISGEMAVKACDFHCSQSCKDVANWYRNGYQKQAFGLYPFSNSSMLSTELYSKFERAAELCLRDEAYAPLSVNDLKWGLYREITPRQKDYIIKWLQKSLNDFNETDQGENLWEAMIGLSKQVKQKYLSSESLIKLSEEENIGWYTEEQEADELSLEWMAMVGVDPRYGVSAYLQLADMQDPSQSCRELQQRGWVDEVGLPARVSLGGFIDPHHDSCYRAWNVEQEIDAHHYTFVPHMRSGLAWESVKQYARSL
ncbi:MAG: hypothetical protein AB8C84_00300 [Oligoflexales bacterium]